MKLKDSSKEESISLSRTKKEDLEPWTTLEFLMKRKTRLLNSKRKYRTSKKDSEEPQRGKTNLKKKSFD